MPNRDWTLYDKVQAECKWQTNNGDCRALLYFKDGIPLYELCSEENCGICSVMEQVAEY